MTVLVGALLASCGGQSTAPTGPGVIAIPSLMNSVPTKVSAAPDAAKAGIYVSGYWDTSIFAYKSNYKRGHEPLCTIFTGQTLITDIAADPEGNLIVPQAAPPSIDVYSGPGMCGPKLGRISDPYGSPVDAASLNAAGGTIVVADSQTVSSSKTIGNIAICTVSGGCTNELTNSNITGYAAGVALAKNGDCWLDSENAGSRGAALTYWAACSGPGQAVTGFKNVSYGGLSIDKEGNILSIDALGGGTGQLRVYSGCNPACTVVGGPFKLKNEPAYGALNAKGDTFGVMERHFPYGGIVDIYKYTPTMLTYKYSFITGFEAITAPWGFAYSPALNL